MLNSYISCFPLCNYKYAELRNEVPLVLINNSLLELGKFKVVVPQITLCKYLGVHSIVSRMMLMCSKKEKEGSNTLV